MLLYSYFARRSKRREEAREAEHNAPQQDGLPHLVISDHGEGPANTEDAEDDSGEKTPTSPTSPTSPTNGLQTPGATLSPTRSGPAPGLTPLDSHASSVGTTEQHEEHPDVGERA